jgi:GTP-binding protein HflX
MSTTVETAEKPERAFLVGVQTERAEKAEAESLLDELQGLVSSLGLETAGTALVKLRERTSALLLGSGKTEEIVQAAKASEADSIIFDHPLSPVQQRNWESQSGLRVYDRSELIIRIFASRARTKEAALQVELAQLEYSLPRLAHSYENLSRQRGGRYGTKGSGEQKIELDRREIEKRIHEIKDELKDIRKSREVSRSRRNKAELPTAAIVGYTNSGKSTLLNALANANARAEDRLFATLDPMTRRLVSKKGRSILLTDTVGFVRNLPHNLIEAFKATLEEAALADLLIIVADASDPEIASHLETTGKVLREIGAGERPSLLVLNKIDLIGTGSNEIPIGLRYPEALCVSAKTGEGLEALAAALEARLAPPSFEARLRIPDAEYALVALLHREATVLEESHDGEATILHAVVPEKLRSRFEGFALRD